MSNEEMFSKIQKMFKAEITVFNAKDLMNLFHINRNKATEFLKKYGVKIGCYCIEKQKLLELLRTETGDLL